MFYSNTRLQKIIIEHADHMDNDSNKLFSAEYFGYHINMLISSAIRYRNLFFLAAFFCVLCLSPLADIHLEGSSETKSFTHGQKHNETIFAMFLHEVLFNQLQHTLDNVFPGISYPSVNINKNTPLKGKIFTSFSQTVCNANSQMITEHLVKGVVPFNDNERAVDTFSRNYSGLSPPLV